jgi:hypothetical protein
MIELAPPGVQRDLASGIRDVLRFRFSGKRLATAKDANWDKAAMQIGFA